MTPSVYSQGEDFSEASFLASDLDHGPEGVAVTLDALRAVSG